MRYVDHDPLAARRAAVACREAADELRVVGRLLDDGAGDLLAAWAGRSRLTFDDAAADLAGDVRAEAVRLEALADDIDAATARAHDAEDRRHAQHLAELRRLREQQAADRCVAGEP